MSEINNNGRTANDRYIHMAEKYSGKPVTLYRADGTEYREDGYINLVNKYGTQKDTQEHYHYVPEPIIPDEQLEQIYESNGLFAKIIDAPAEEAIKHGFTIKGAKDEVNEFVQGALDELDWDETAISGLSWTRLFGGVIAVLLINDGRGIDEPLDWKHIESIDDIRLYDRSVVVPDYTTMFAYSVKDPFKTRGSRLGEPEYYHVYSKYGAFTVHESRCLVFRNGKLPEKCTNSLYEFWGIPEYLRIKRALRDTELAHSSGSKMLDKAVQPIYKMKDLSQVLTTEEGEDNVLKRLQAIDLARGMLDSIAIDADGEDYHFETFTYTGVSDIINITCNYLSALTNIPQTILFGRSPAGMDATGNADLENWYNYIGRLQKKMVKSNLRYLLSIICQAGAHTGELKEVPKLDIEFNPLWSLSETEQATLDQTKAATAQTRATTAQMYVSMGAADPSEIRKGLAEEGDFDIEDVIEEDYTDDDLFADYNKMQGVGGNSPDAAPAATKLPQDMTGEEKAQQAAGQQQSAITGTQAVQSVEDKKKGEEPDNTDEEEVPETAYESPEHMSVGVVIVSQGRILNATRNNDTKHGQICGPGGHIEQGETAEQAAIRETQEEFGITPSQLIRLGYGPMERDTGLSPVVFLCTNYTGKVKCDEVEMIYPRFSTLKELEAMDAWLYKPFKYGIELMKTELGFDAEEDSQTNLDSEDDDIQWITVNGTHVPLKNGEAVSGPLKGEEFSRAESEKTTATKASTFKKGKGDFEITGKVRDLYLTDTARKKIDSATAKVKTANDLKQYLSEKGIDLVVDYKPLQEHMSDEIDTVKKQMDQVIAAVEQYSELGGLSKLKAIHIYNPDLDVQAQYSYKAKNEGEVDDEGQLYISDRATGYNIMHEFAHAFADSTKPEGMDCVEWSSKLNELAGLSQDVTAYTGANSADTEAERFANAVGAALCFGEGNHNNLSFLSKVVETIKDNPTETADKPTGSKYASKFDYEQAKKKAKADIEPRLQEIHSKYDAKTKAIHDKYGSKIQQSVEIKQDKSLSDEEKSQKLKELNDKFEKCAEERAEMEDAYSKELQDADDAYRTTFEPDYEYKKIEGKHSIEDDVKRDVINPNKLHFNCQRCAIAFEMRRRGYDVEVSDGEGDALGLGGNFGNAFTSTESEYWSSTDTQQTTENVCDKMKEWGDGARAFVTTHSPDGYGHVYNLCNEKGEIWACDSQQGFIYSDKTSLEAGGRINLGLDDTDFVRLDRVDNAIPCIGILDYVKERNGGQ